MVIENTVNSLRLLRVIMNNDPNSPDSPAEVSEGLNDIADDNPDNPDIHGGPDSSDSSDGTERTEVFSHLQLAHLFLHNSKEIFTRFMLYISGYYHSYQQRKQLQFTLSSSSPSRPLSFRINSSKSPWLGLSYSPSPLEGVVIKWVFHMLDSDSSSAHHHLQPNWPGYQCVCVAGMCICIIESSLGLSGLLGLYMDSRYIHICLCIYIHSTHTSPL